MAKPNTLSYTEALEGIAQPKYWRSKTQSIKWVKTSKKSWPHHYKAFIGVLTEGAFQEGTRVELFYKESQLIGAPATINMNFIYKHAVIFAVHEGPPTKHVNRVGKGEKYYQQIIDHPHKHLPVLESSYGYAEPLKPMSVNELWYLFQQEANILDNIDFQYPNELQGRLL